MGPAPANSNGAPRPHHHRPRGPAPCRSADGRCRPIVDRLGPPVEPNLEEDLRQGMGDQVVQGPAEPLGQEAEEDGEGKAGHLSTPGA